MAERETSRASKIAALLHAGEFSDVHLVAGDPPERVPASRVLLAACSEQLAIHLREAAEAGRSTEVSLPEITATAARALVAHSCGVANAFDGCSSEEASSVAQLLESPLPGIVVGKGGSAPSSRGRVQLEENSWQPGQAACWLGILSGSLAAYAPARRFNLEMGGFFMDDSMIKKNEVVWSEKLDIYRLLTTDYWGLAMFDPDTWTHKSWRPLTVLTFRWNFLAHTYNSCGWHVSNVLLHAVCCLQLWWFGLKVLRLPWTWSGLLACLFAVHPVHTESLLYIVGRADILCAQVMLLALESYRPCAASADSSWVLALFRLLVAMLLILTSGLCKETGFTFFGLLVGWEVLSLTGGRDGRRGVLGRCLRVFVLLLVGAAACALRVWYTSGTQIARMDPYSNPIAACKDQYVRVLSYALVHGMYFKLLVWPVFLCYDYSMDAVPLVRSLEDVRLLLPVASYLGFTLAVCASLSLLRSWRRKAARLMVEGPLLGVGIFVLSFLPMTNILFPIGTLVAERLLYIPSLGFLVVLVCLSHAAVLHFPLRAVKLGVWFVLLGLLSFWWYLCYNRVLDWETVEKITVVDGWKQLRSSRTQFNLANILLLEQKFDEALAAYHRAIAADPEERDAQPLYHAGQILMYKGQYEEAEKYLHKAVSGYFSPLTLHEEEVWHDYGLALWHTGKTAEAVQNFRNALITQPAFPKGYNNLACALVLLGLSTQPPNVELASQGIQAMQTAIEMLPGSALYWRNAAALLGLVGEQQQAVSSWRKYQELDPEAAAAAEAHYQGLPNECIWQFYFR